MPGTLSGKCSKAVCILLTLRFKLEVVELIRAGLHLAVHANLTDPPRDEMAVLRAKVQNEDGIIGLC